MMVEQSRQASERIADAERVKNSAAQEPAYYRAKLSALENGRENDAQNMERERLKDLEKSMSALMTERWNQERKIKELGNVQNWAEVLERDFLVLEETMRLVREGSGSDGESCSECSRSSQMLQYNKSTKRHHCRERKWKALAC